jgi:very-short-patch-repair endonuclease
LLWRHLRGDPEGIRFRRQHEINEYVLDFYCPKAKLAIEVDGIAHDMGDQPGFDSARAAVLADLGIETLRIPAIDVLRDPAEVADRIVKYAFTKRF